MKRSYPFVSADRIGKRMRYDARQAQAARLWVNKSKAIVRQLQRRPTPILRSNLRTGGFSGRELKYVDYQLAAQDISATWTGGELDPATTLCLNTVTQGTGESQRIGKKITMTGVTIKGFIYNAASESIGAPSSDALCRIALVLDAQTNKAQLNAEDVFEVDPTVDFVAHREQEYTQRFQVLKDKIIRLPTSNALMNEGAANLFAVGQVMIPFKINYNFKQPCHVNFVSSADPATVAEIADYSLHLIGVYTGAVAVVPKITYHSRLRYLG